LHRRADCGDDALGDHQTAHIAIAGKIPPIRNPEIHVVSSADKCFTPAHEQSLDVDVKIDFFVQLDSENPIWCPVRQSQMQMVDRCAVDGS
jgi:hypothetical protein